MTIKFIGDLSVADAKVLRDLAMSESVNEILEFGAGGSTQIFAQCYPEVLVSVETDPNWITLTRKRLEQIEDGTETFFLNYELFPEYTKGSVFDLIFVDGVDNLRKDFAIKTWDKLKVGGVMVFHDTRRFQDFQNAAWVAQLFFEEVDKIEVNYKNSNMTLIYKKQAQPYVNWNHVENKPLWAYGGVPNTEDKELWILED